MQSCARVAPSQAERQSAGSSWPDCTSSNAILRPPAVTGIRCSPAMPGTSANCNHSRMCHGMVITIKLGPMVVSLLGTTVNFFKYRVL